MIEGGRIISALPFVWPDAGVSAMPRSFQDTHAAVAGSLTPVCLEPNALGAGSHNRPSQSCPPAIAAPAHANYPAAEPTRLGAGEGRDNARPSLRAEPRTASLAAAGRPPASPMPCLRSRFWGTSPTRDELVSDHAQGTTPAPNASDQAPRGARSWKRRTKKRLDCAMQPSLQTDITATRISRQLRKWTRTSVVFAVRAKPAAKHEVDRGRVGQGERQDYEAGAPEQERQRGVWRRRLLDRQRERQDVG